MCKIYIIYSQKIGKFYIGSTRDNDINIRLKAHNSGKNRSTKYGKPWILLYEENYVNYTQARKRELFLKTGIGRQWIYNKFQYIKERWQSGRMRRSCLPEADPPWAEKP